MNTSHKHLPVFTEIASYVNEAATNLHEGCQAPGPKADGGGNSRVMDASAKTWQPTYRQFNVMDQIVWHTTCTNNPSTLLVKSICLCSTPPAWECKRSTQISLLTAWGRKRSTQAAWGRQRSTLTSLFTAWGRKRSTQAAWGRKSSAQASLTTWGRKRSTQVAWGRKRSTQCSLFTARGRKLSTQAASFITYSLGAQALHTSGLGAQALHTSGLGAQALHTSNYLQLGGASASHKQPGGASAPHRLRFVTS
jgi:hypothetical protein